MYLMKTTLLGDGAVGKTALRERYLGKGFQASYLMTVGADFAVKEVNINYNGQDIQVKFSIWDLAGQPRFTGVREMYYKGSAGGILVFDVTRRDSFLNLPTWVNELFTHNGKGPIPLVVLGNKIDLRSTAKDYVTPEEGQQFVEKLREQYPKIEIKYLETSAKTGENVEKAFEEIARSVIKFLSATASK